MVDSELQETRPEGRAGPARLRARLFGAFSLTDLDGVDLAPRSAKARALVALALISPREQRSRSFLAQALWSDRGTAQALGSLRQAISEVRRALGPHHDCLVIDRKVFGFAPGTVLSDIEEGAARVSSGHPFLEDLKANDPVFREWLTRTREQFTVRSNLRTKPLIHVRAVGTADPMRKRLVDHGIAEEISSWCALRVASVGDNAKAFSENAAESFANYILEARLEAVSDGTAAHVSLVQGDPALPRWSLNATLTGQTDNPLDDPALFRLVNRAAQRTMIDLAPPHRDTETSGYLTAGTLGAVRLLFRNSPGDLVTARRTFERNFEIHRQGIYPAWLAYLTTLEMVEQNAADQHDLRERARDLCAKALELDPYGSMTLALCSYVHSLVLGQAEIGHDLASRAIDSNRSNTLAWLFRGAAQYFGGNAGRALQDTRFARQICPEAPFGYVVDTFSCAAATAAAEYDEAISLAERAVAKAPTYKAPLRFLVAIHAARGDIDALRLAIRRLRKLEPDFTLESLRNRHYPVPGLRAVGLATVE